MNYRNFSTFALAAAVALSACSPRDRENTDAGSSSKEVPQATLTVKEIDLGRALAPDKSVTARAESFRPAETIYASVRTEGTGRGKVSARWTFQDGQTVEESSEEISPDGPARTEFHIAKEGGLPVGKYRVEIRLNDDVAGSKEFEVK